MPQTIAPLGFEVLEQRRVLSASIGGAAMDQVDQPAIELVQQVGDSTAITDGMSNTIMVGEVYRGVHHRVSVGLPGDFNDDGIVDSAE